MSLNGRKSEFVMDPQFSEKLAGSPSVRIGSEVVSSTASARYLGIIFDANLSWKDRFVCHEKGRS